MLRLRRRLGACGCAGLQSGAVLPEVAIGLQGSATPLRKKRIGRVLLLSGLVGVVEGGDLARSLNVLENSSSAVWSG